MLGVLIKDGLFAIVRPSIIEDLFDVSAEVIHASVRIHIDFPLNYHVIIHRWLLYLLLRTWLESIFDLCLYRFKVHGVLDDLIIIAHFLLVDRLAKWP